LPRSDDGASAFFVSAEFVVVYFFLQMQSATSSSNSLANTIRREFPRRKIVVVGDLVADQFLHGKIARVSREAPVFILRHEHTTTAPGGAANAAANVAGLGGKVCLVGLIGRDRNGEALLESLKKANVDCAFLTVAEKMQTTTKLRVLASQHYAARQQVIRIDYENDEAPTADLISQLRESLTAAAENADAIVVSDYDYGVACQEIAGLAAQIAGEKKIPLLVDSRRRLTDFAGATSATPNQEEAEQIIGEKFATGAGGSATNRCSSRAAIAE
jgi:D-glycero-beta-D-manno-heptose-7-phosphate kinase